MKKGEAHENLENTRFFIDSNQCVQMLLGCCYDTGYVPFLGQFTADKAQRERVTLLEGRETLPEVIKGLGFRIISLADIFMTSGRLRGGREVALAENSSGASTSSAIRSVPAKPKKRHAIHVLKKDLMRTQRLGPVPLDGSGRRIDKQLHADGEAVAWVRRMDLCPYLYLRGECCFEFCRKKHDCQLKLTDSQFDALWLLLRHGKCYRQMRGNNCLDPLCLFGHETDGDCTLETTGDSGVHHQ